MLLCIIFCYYIVGTKIQSCLSHLTFCLCLETKTNLVYRMILLYMKVEFDHLPMREETGQVSSTSHVNI